VYYSSSRQVPAELVPAFFCRQLGRSGLGFAAARDLLDVLRNATADDSGTANPLAGDVQDLFSIVP
jgi:hypothetical protein